MRKVEESTINAITKMENSTVKDILEIIRISDAQAHRAARAHEVAARGRPNGISKGREAYLKRGPLATLTLTPTISAVAGPLATLTLTPTISAVAGPLATLTLTPPAPRRLWLCGTDRMSQ
ncbi:hypothetical protein V8C26DRAFT_424942 [Trichoderma gracile]